MNDDLKLLLTIVDTDTADLENAAVLIPGGMNNFRDWMYFKEVDVAAKYISMFPELNLGDNRHIVKAEEIGDIIVLKERV